MKYIKQIVFIVVIITTIILYQNAIAATTFSNESINNIRAIQKGMYAPDEVDDDSKINYIIDVNYFVNVTGDPTNTYTVYNMREMFETEIDVNSLNNVNKTIRNAIKNNAKERWNYTLPDSKILMIAYTKGNNI